MDRKVVEDKKQLIDLIFELLDDNDAVKWENDTAYEYLQAVGAWLNDCGGYYENTGQDVDANEASWQLFADALQAGRIYE